MSSHRSAWIKGTIKYAVAFVLLALVVSLNWTSLSELFSRTPNGLAFATATALFASMLFLQYLRWYVLVRALDLPFTIRNAMRLGMVGTFYNTFLPGAIGGDIVKAVFIAKGQPNRRATAVATVIADRALGLFGLLLFGAAVGGGFWLSGDAKIIENQKLQWIIQLCMVLSGAGFLGYVLLGFLPERRADRFAQRLLSLKKIGKTLAELWDVVRQYRARPKAVLLGVLISALAHTGMMLTFHFAVRIFPPEDVALLGTMPEHFVIAPIGFIVQALIPLPGGLGGGEFTFGSLYRLIRGAEGEAVGLAGRLSLRVVEWTLGLVGYIAYLRMKDELPVNELSPDEDDLAAMHNTD